LPTNETVIKKMLIERQINAILERDLLLKTFFKATLKDEDKRSANLGIDSIFSLLKSKDDASPESRLTDTLFNALPV
jgi:hypothetical protein